MEKGVSAVAWLLVCILSLMELKNIFVPKWTDDMAPTLTIDGFMRKKEQPGCDLLGPVRQYMDFLQWNFMKVPASDLMSVERDRSQLSVLITGSERH